MKNCWNSGTDHVSRQDAHEKEVSLFILWSQKVAVLAPLATKRDHKQNYWSGRSCLGHKQIKCFVSLFCLRFYSPTSRRFWLFTRTSCPWWKSCSSLSLMPIMKWGAASCTLWVMHALLYISSLSSWSCHHLVQACAGQLQLLRISLTSRYQMQLWPLSTAGNDKMQHVVNLSLWINHIEGVHMLYAWYGFDILLTPTIYITFLMQSLEAHWNIIGFKV